MPIVNPSPIIIPEQSFDRFFVVSMLVNGIRNQESGLLHDVSVSITVAPYNSESGKDLDGAHHSFKISSMKERMEKDPKSELSLAYAAVVLAVEKEIASFNGKFPKAENLKG